MHTGGERLLDRLWRMVGCPYLSDLRLDPARLEALCRAVRETPEEAFPSEQWREALDYLVGEAPAEDPAPRDRLLCGLEERRRNSPLDKDGLG